ncbi:hypothetical protein QJS66_01675 [Kocuria rhizophila]|nr:hypothetical protein QJS66_01675 [Kocuria rhizophila]
MSGATEHENFASVEEIYQGLPPARYRSRMAPRLDAMQLAGLPRWAPAPQRPGGAGDRDDGKHASPRRAWSSPAARARPAGGAATRAGTWSA